MGGLFSKKASRTLEPVKNTEVTEQDEAILKLKHQRDRIKQFVKRKEKCIEKERDLAKQLIHEGRKNKALLILKKKRHQENVIDQTLKQLDQIEKMVQDLEFADIQQRVVEGLRNGNEALKNMNQLFDLDEIEKIMDETKEAAEYQEEISQLISGKLSTTDIADVEKELDELLASDVASTLPEVPAALPEVDEIQEQEKEKPQKKREAVALEA